jgi:ribosome-associated protein
MELAPGVRVATGTVRFQFARGSGPGGQNVNKVNTKAELWVPVEAMIGLTYAARDRLRKLAGSKLTKGDDIHIASDSSRSQEGNRQEILDILRGLIVQARHEPKKRRKTRPTRGSKERRLTAKRHRSEIKGHRGGGVGE